MITDQEAGDVTALLEQLRGGIGSDNESVLAQLVDICSALCVSVSQLSAAVKKIADGLDDVHAVMDEQLFDPMEKAVHCKHVQILKGQLDGEGRNFGEYSEAYRRIFDRDLLDEVAEDLLKAKQAVGEGEEFDQEAWLNDRYAGLKNRMDGMREIFTAKEPEGQSVEIEIEKKEGGPEGDNGDTSSEDLIRATRERLAEMG